MDNSLDQSVIKIQRKDHFLTKGGHFKVYIDEQMIGNIGTNSSEEFLVEPGQHKVLIKAGWSKSNELIVQSDLGKSSSLSCGCHGPVINSLFIIVLMQFFIPQILEPFHLSQALTKSIDTYYFVIILIITVTITFIPSAITYVKKAES